jgi:hypothetical protein
MTTIRNLLTGRTMESRTHHLDGICPVQVTTVTGPDGALVEVTLDDPARAFRVLRAVSLDDLTAGGWVPPAPCDRGGPAGPPTPARPTHPSLQDEGPR